MLCLKQNARVALVVIHEIYGVNQHIKHFSENLFSNGFDVWCPNLLNVANPFKYEQEQAAYRHFMSQVGIQKAKDTLIPLLKEIKKDYDLLILIGFSVGATVAWLCSEEDVVDGIIGFYGSRIRDYKGLKPTCPVFLIFPETEPSFNVDDLMSCLSKKEKVLLEKYPARHGFCDPASPNYKAPLGKRAFAQMMKFIDGLSHQP